MLGGLLQARGAAGGDSPPVPCSVPSQRGNGDWGSQRPAAAPCCVLGSQTGILARADSTAHHVFGCIEGKSSTSLEAEHCCPCSPRGVRCNIASGISAHNCFSNICLLGHTKQSETHPKTEFVTLLPPAVNLETRAGFLMGRGVRLPPPHQHPGVLRTLLRTRREDGFVRVHPGFCRWKLLAIMICIPKQQQD